MFFKKIFQIMGMSLLVSSMYAQPGRIDSSLFPLLNMHSREEYTLDRPVDPASWQKEKPGLHVSFASTNEAYFRAEVPRLKNEMQTWEETGWKGERLNAMILVWSPDTINQVRFILNDLKNAQGNVLSKSDLKLNMVRYVLSNYPYDAKNASCSEGPVDKAYLVPDRLDPITTGKESFDIPGRTLRPVWVSINIPPGTIPSVYNGTIEVRSDNGAVILHMKIKVQNQLLPPSHDWAFRLDLWQNPWVIADYYHVKPWSETHKALLKEHLKLYADAGGKYITTYGVHSPWGDNEYYMEGGMIEWIKKDNGSWKFDYSIFDQYVELAMSVGIDKAITIYTPLPWGERFRYLNEATGSYVYERWLPGSDTFKTNWNAFLTNLKAHLEEKGWFKKTYLGVNENAMMQTLSAIRVIRDHSKQWRITYAGDWHPELDKLLDDYSCVFNKEPGINDINKRASNHQTSTFYICCTPAKPNTFVFSPPVEGRWLGWYALAHGYDGMLRWAYDSWTADPVRDTRHVFWPAGDCFMVYPGANSSIRFEKFREGIVDYEKIRILRMEASRSAKGEVKRIMEELEKQLQLFIAEKDFESATMADELQKGKEMVNTLSEKLKH